MYLLQIPWAYQNSEVSRISVTPYLHSTILKMVYFNSYWQLVHVNGYIKHTYI